MKYTIYTLAALVILMLVGFAFVPKSIIGIGATARQQRETKITNYSVLLADVSNRITAWEKRIAKDVAGHSSDWLSREFLAKALLERAQLTHQPEDYLRVQQVLDEALAIAPPGSGPLLTAARFNFTIHRLEKAEEYLDVLSRRASLRHDDVLAAELLRADIALQRGDYEKALATYHECERLSKGLCVSRLATFYSETGGLSESEALLRHALSVTEKEAVYERAWINLQLAILSMEQGQLDEALTRLGESRKILPGWWLAEEHVAEILALKGRHDEAATIYEAVIAKTNLPQYMDALAESYKALGRAEEAEKLIAQAEQSWNAQLQQLPESAGAHALDHYLSFAQDYDRAVSLAEKNVKTRPGGPARVLLAQAYLKAGRAADALVQIKKIFATPYRKADAHEAALATYRALGDKARAEEERRQLISINPSFS